MDIKQCDRCKKAYDPKAEGGHGTIIEISRKCLLGLEATDLCPECMEQFRQWRNNKDTCITHQLPQLPKLPTGQPVSDDFVPAHHCRVYDEPRKEEGPKKYRKKPVVVEAIQCTAGNLEQVLAFAGESAEWNTEAQRLYIETLEGRHLATQGDYIIRGIAGEYYPCKLDVFTETYEEEPDNA